MSFGYINSLGNNIGFDENDQDYNDITKNIKKVTFDIGRYGKIQHTIKFKELVTLKTAIKTVEDFLCKPLTRYWFNKIQKNNDLFPTITKFEKGWCKGDLLGDCIFLEIAKVDENGNLTLQCGS